MQLEGGCFCGAVRYKTEGDPIMKGQCHCRQCQHCSGGAPNVFIAMPKAGFAYTRGAPKRYARADAPVFPATREFCGECGAPLTSLAGPLPEVVFVKVGSLDDPAAFVGPDLAIFTCDRQAFHLVPEGVSTFDKMPSM